MYLVEAATEFVATTRDDEDAGTAMAEFIRSEFAKRFDDLHIELEDGGDNGDNGNHVICIKTRTSMCVPKAVPPTKDEIKEAKKIAYNNIATAIQRLDILKRELERTLKACEDDLNKGD